MSNFNDENEREEFAERWAVIMAKLTRDEQDFVSTVISGSEVNHSLLYGVLFGFAGMLLGWLAKGFAG